MAEYVIKHAGVEEDYYLKDVRKERLKDLQPVHSLKKPGRPRKNPEEETPRGESIATWTKDLTSAMYFQSMKQAKELIEKWPVLRFAVILEA